VLKTAGEVVEAARDQAEQFPADLPCCIRAGQHLVGLPLHQLAQW
jgi:hypothetical protein